MTDLTLEEKIEHLRKATMEDARADGNRILDQHKASIDQIFEDHKETALRQAQLSIKTEENNSKQQQNKVLSTTLVELKREQGRTQSQLKNQLFQKVRNLVDDYMKSPAYADLLVSYMKQAIAFAKDEPLQVYINASDEAKVPYLAKETGITPTISKEDFIGGTRAVLRNSNVLIDRSFASAIADEQDNFFFSGGSSNE